MLKRLVIRNEINVLSFRLCRRRNRIWLRICKKRRRSNRKNIEPTLRDEDILDTYDHTIKEITNISEDKDDTIEVGE